MERPAGSFFPSPPAVPGQPVSPFTVAVAPGPGGSGSAGGPVSAPPSPFGGGARGPREEDPIAGLARAYGDPLDTAWGAADWPWLLWAGAQAPAAALVAWWRVSRLVLVTRNQLEEGRPLQEAYGDLAGLLTSPDFVVDELYVDAEHRHPLLAALHDPETRWTSAHALVLETVWASSPVQRLYDSDQGIGVRRAVRGSLVPTVPDCEALFDFEATLVDWITERLVSSPERTVAKALTRFLGCGTLEMRDVLELGKQQIRSSVAFDMANERALHITRLQHLLEKATSAMELNVQFRVLHELARVQGLTKVMPTDLPAEISAILHAQSQKEERGALRIAADVGGDGADYLPDDVEADADDQDMDMLVERARAGVETLPPPVDEMG